MGRRSGILCRPAFLRGPPRQGARGNLDVMKPRSVRNLVGLAVIALLIGNWLHAGDLLTEYRMDTTRVCQLVGPAYSRGNYAELASELQRQLGVDQGKIRIRKDGVFVQTFGFFVHESGYFIARDRDFNFKNGGDPSFRPIKDCIFAYDIKG